VTQTISSQQLMQSAMTHHRDGQLQEAYNHYMDVIKIEPRNFDALHLAGVILVQVGQYEPALELFNKAIGNRPKDAEAHYNKANALFSLGRFKESLAMYGRAIELRPESPLAYMGQGNALQALGEYQAAVFSYDSALKYEREYALIYFNRGNALEELGIHDHAITSFNYAIALQPGYAEALDNKGNILLKLKDFAQAKATYQQSIDANPSNEAAFVNLGNAQLELQEYADALKTFDHAIGLAPDNAMAHHSLSHCLLQVGRFDRAWDEYAWRWKTPEFLAKGGLFTFKPVWNKEVPCDRLLVWAEQGVGDEIFWGGLLSEVNQLAPKVIVQLDARLISLFSATHPGIEFVARDTRVPEDQYDAHLPMGDLGAALRASPIDFDKTRLGYLLPDAQRAATIRKALCKPGQKLCGVSWKSKNANFGDEKSLTLEALLPSLKLPGMVYVNLQYGDVAQEIADLKAKHGVDILQYSEVDNFSDLLGLADLIEACDVVLTTSNSTAHLAGALNKDTVIMLPFGRGRIWYWINEKEGHSLWYPSVQIAAQSAPAQDWSGVATQAAQLLAQRS
jgi:tetratricopeptide (TPR) repeat protein